MKPLQFLAAAEDDLAFCASFEEGLYLCCGRLPRDKVHFGREPLVLSPHDTRGQALDFGDERARGGTLPHKDYAFEVAHPRANGAHRERDVPPEDLGRLAGHDQVSAVVVSPGPKDADLHRAGAQFETVVVVLAVIDQQPDVLGPDHLGRLFRDPEAMAQDGRQSRLRQAGGAEEAVLRPAHRWVGVLAQIWHPIQDRLRSDGPQVKVGRIVQDSLNPVITDNVHV